MNPDSPLKTASSKAWLDCVIKDFDNFLLDHAAAEKKASGMAISMISHYPDRPELVAAMADLAIEELNHYKEVIKHIYARGLQLAPDVKDEYVHALHKHIRKGSDVYFIDRLLIASVIEARGAERFKLISEALTDQSLKRFYQAIAASEQRHYTLFLDLANKYFDACIIENRFQELLGIEASIIENLPLAARLH